MKRVSSSATRARSASTSESCAAAAPDTASNVAGDRAIHHPMPARTSGAPRLIEATGERIVPWARDAQVIYEHLHRYLWAQPLVAGRRVLGDPLPDLDR